MGSFWLLPEVSRSVEGLSLWVGGWVGGWVSYVYSSAFEPPRSNLIHPPNQDIQQRVRTASISSILSTTHPPTHPPTYLGMIPCEWPGLVPESLSTSSFLCTTTPWLVYRWRKRW